jgi:hypothetical protein
MSARRGRGRPVGWRKPDARRRPVMFRLAEAPWQWLRVQARFRRSSVSEVLRCLVERAMIEGIPRPFTSAEATRISCAARAEARRLLQRKKLQRK